MQTALKHLPKLTWRGAQTDGGPGSAPESWKQAAWRGALTMLRLRQPRAEENGREKSIKGDFLAICEPRRMQATEGQFVGSTGIPIGNLVVRNRRQCCLRTQPHFGKDAKGRKRQKGRCGAADTPLRDEWSVAGKLRRFANLLLPKKGSQSRDLVCSLKEEVEGLITRLEWPKINLHDK